MHPKKVVCIYHRADMDGRCAGAIVRRRFGAGVVLVGWDYGEPVPWDQILPADEVWVVDCCLPGEDMLRLQAEAGELVWCDHHKTALDWAAELGFCCAGERSLREAGCELTWAAAFGSVDMPMAVYLLGRYDVWDHAGIPFVLPFHAAVSLRFPRPDNDEFWNPILSPLYKADAEVQKLVEEGRAVMRVREADDALCARAMCYDVVFEGISALAANLKPANSRTVLSMVRPDHRLLVLYGYQAGKGWVVSLYNPEHCKEVDCGAIAKRHGGGGHPGAAGFVCQELPPSLLGSLGVDPQDPSGSQRR